MGAENTTAGAENSATTAENYDARIAEIVGAEPPKAEGATEQEPQKTTETAPDTATTTPQVEKADEGTPAAEEKKPETEEKPAPESSVPAAADGVSDSMSRIEKRIVFKAVQNATLMGQELDPDQVQAVLSGKSLAEKKQILRELLAENAKLRGAERAEAGEEDIEAMAEARAQEIAEASLAEKEIAAAEKAEESRKEEWGKTLASVIKDNPALDEKSPEYNPVLADALQIMLSDDGETPRYSVDPKVAWEKVQAASSIAQERVQAEIEKGRSAALSGALSGSGSPAPTGGMTWEEIERLSEEDPREYMRLVREGKIPKS